MKKRVNNFFLVLGKKNVKKQASNSFKSISEEIIDNNDTLITVDKLEQKNKNILLIGRTGNGKSTLANVLIGTDKFKESSGSTSETKEIQNEIFEESSIKYQVIDTPGIGDTNLPTEEILDIIAEAVYLVRHGVNHVFFVSKTRFDQDEMLTYDILREIIFDKNITNYTTIIRTRFNDFRKPKKCEQDIKLMAEKSDEIAEIINSCEKRIIHLDNPSLSILANDNENDEEKSEREIRINSNKAKRNKSREIILEHLSKSCQDFYIPPKLKELSDEISCFMEAKIESKRKLEEKNKKKEEKAKLANKQIFILEDDEKKSENILPLVKKDSEVKVITEKEDKKEQELANNQAVGNTSDFMLIKVQKQNKDRERTLIKSKITSLAKEIKELKSIKELKEKIKEKDNIIRQKVLDHIFNNYNNITQLKKGNIFINKIIGANSDFAHCKKTPTFAELQEQKKELEKKLQEKGENDQSLDEIKSEINQKEQELLNSKKWLLANDEPIVKEWQNQGFNIQEAQEWADVLKSTFNPENDALFCTWLRDNKQLTTAELIEIKNLEELKQEYKNHLEQQETIYTTDKQQLNWTDLHPAFAKKYWRSNQTWQQEWAAAGFTTITAQPWIALGFDPDDLEEVQKWTNQHFTPEEAEQWWVVGLSKYTGSAFATWLRDNNYSPNLTQTKLEQLRAEYNQAWLAEHYPDHRIKKLDISNRGLTGTLDLSHYPQLEELDCRGNQLTNLDLTGCVDLREIKCWINQLTSLDFLATLPQPEKLTYLDLSHNPLLPFVLDSLTALVNLERLNLNGTNVHSSLAPLSQCQKLKILGISHTQLDSDLESLPAQLEELWAYGMPALAEKMTGFGSDYQAWRKAHSPHLPTASTALMQQIKEVEAANKIKEDTKKAQLKALQAQLAAVEAQLLVAQQVQPPK